MKIKSVTDVITNSSSEVFVIRKEDVPRWTGEDHGCINSYSVDIDFFNKEEEALCRIMNWNPEDTGGVYVESYYGNYWDWPTTDNCLKWDEWIESHKKELEDKLKDLIWVDIEDHYDYDSYEIDSSNARSVSIYSEYRH